MINRCAWTRLCVAMADRTIPLSHGRHDDEDDDDDADDDDDF